MQRMLLPSCLGLGRDVVRWLVGSSMGGLFHLEDHGKNDCAHDHARDNGKDDAVLGVLPPELALQTLRRALEEARVDAELLGFDLQAAELLIALNDARNVFLHDGLDLLQFLPHQLDGAGLLALPACTGGA
jgi:hypothetical protein